MNKEAIALFFQFFSVLVGSGILTVIVSAISQRRQNQAAAKQAEVAAEVTDEQLQAAIRKAAYDEMKRLSDKIEVLNSDVSSLNRQVRRLRDRINNLKSSLSIYAQRNEYLMIGIDMLLNQLVSMDKIPVWRPDENWKRPIIADEEEEDCA